MKTDGLMFAGVFGLALAGCAAPAAATDEQPGDGAEHVGKATSAEMMYCSCSGMAGEWHDEYTTSQALSAIDVNCRYGGSCSTSASSSADGYGSTSSSGGYPTPTYGSGGGTPSGGTGSPAGTPGSGGGGGGGGSSAPANSSNIPRDGVFRTTSDYWNSWYTYHDERSEAGFNDGDAVRFFDDMKTARNYQNASAFSSVIPMSYPLSVAIFALGKLSDMQIDAMAAQYQATGRQQGVRVVLDSTTEMMSGRTDNYLIYNISDGTLLGQISMVTPSTASAPTNGGCQYGTYGDVGIAAQSCTNGIKACSNGYNCL
ncbi:MAG: hypothetical protein JWP97_5956 [Labilithrix sp.]|nr:hypothetical protein [Labilithrix sp.]